MGDFITDYIKSIENPDRIGWNGKVWGAPTLKGYDVNQRGYGIDIRYNNAAKNLVKNRKGLWLTDKEVTDLMNLHLLYITGVAKRKIKGFNTFSPKKQAAILGMLYRGDSVQSNVNINEPNDTKFLNAVHTYYKNKGLNQRMLNSINFFSKYLKGGKMNVIEQFKKGYKIKIKESQKGSFTKYCNGKVTNECIQRGKNSPDPKIRKKATFAQNARSWKHLLGGQLIKAEEGTKFLSKQWFQNAGQKVNNFLSSDAGKFAINAGKQIYSNINSGVKLAETKDRLQKWKQAYVNSIEPKDFSLQVVEEEKQIKLANPDYNISPIVSAYKENILATQAANKAKQKASQEADLIIMLLLLNLNELSSSTEGFGSLLTEGLGLAGQFLSSKKSNTGTTNLSTSLNGSPSTYNVFLNNTYTLPSLKTPILPAPTISTKYMTV